MARPSEDIASDLNPMEAVVFSTLQVLDLIHDIAAKASSEDNIPPIVEAAFDKSIAVARYKLNVTDEKRSYSS